MGTYYIDMDVTMSVRMWVRAECETEAHKIAMDSIKREPYYHLRNSAFVDATITESMEE